VADAIIAPKCQVREIVEIGIIRNGKNRLTGNAGRVVAAFLETNGCQIVMCNDAKVWLSIEKRGPQKNRGFFSLAVVYSMVLRLMQLAEV